MYKKTVISLSSLAVMATLAGAPLAAFAQTPAPATTPSKNFCTMINGSDVKALMNLDLKEKKMEEKYDDRDTQKDARRKENDAQRQTREAEQKNRFGEREDKMLEKVKQANLTDAQKATIAQAQTNIQKAIDTKNGDFQNLVGEFRNQMDGVRSAHRAELDTLVASVRTKTEAAVAKAKADCAAGIAPETVKKNFQDAIKSIHDGFKVEQKNLQTSTKAQVDQKLEERKTQAVSTRATFKDSVKSAWSSFRSLFGKKSSE